MPPKKTKGVKFEPKDLVLAKMPGWSAWPSFVMPKDMIPSSVLNVKKKSTEYCVIFIPDGDFYWMTEKSLDSLSEDVLDKKLEKIPNKEKPKKGRTLNVNDALLAARGLSFDDFMKSLDIAPNDEDVDASELDEDSKGEEDEFVDEIEEDKVEDEELEEVDQGAGENQDKSNRKRNREESRNGQRKTPKTVNKKKSTNEKTSNLPTKLKETPTVKVQTEEEKQHQLWLCRIKLQRSLIQRNQPVTPTDPRQFPPPSADELSVSRLILHRLVDFPVTIDLMKKTKIHKVLKCILRDEDLEYPDSFKLHEKCDELLDKWSPLIESIKLEKSAKTHTNGSAKKDQRKSENSPLATNLPDDSEVSAIENSTTQSNTDLNDKSSNSSHDLNIEHSDLPSTTYVES